MTNTEIIDLLQRRLRYLQGKRSEYNQAWSRYSNRVRQQIASQGERPNQLEFWLYSQYESWDDMDEEVAEYMSPAAENLRNALARVSEILDQANQITRINTPSEGRTLDDLISQSAREYDTGRQALMMWRNSSSVWADPELGYLDRFLAAQTAAYGVQTPLTSTYSPVRTSSVSETAVSQAITHGQQEEDRRANQIEQDRVAALTRQLKWVGAGAAAAAVIYVYYKVI
jgi:hypothetical protein